MLLYVCMCVCMYVCMYVCSGMYVNVVTVPSTQKKPKTIQNKKK